MSNSDNVQVSLCSRNEGGKLLVVFASDVLEGQNCSSLLVDDCSETSLGLDDDVGHAHLERKNDPSDWHVK